MDILNFISWIRGKRKVTSVDPAKTVIPLGIKDGRRDDDYLAVAMTVEDFAAQIAPQPTYKVYTALLTQSGGSDQLGIQSGDLTIGVTYRIEQTNPDCDWTNAGAPNNNVGTYFVATGTTPNNWGTDGLLIYNPGAPVVTVLENTIGNIWFTYNDVGYYQANSNGLFTIGKTFSNIEPSAVDIENYRNAVIDHYGTNFSSSDINIFTGDFTGQISSNNYLNNTPIEIRVYN